MQSVVLNSNYNNTYRKNDSSIAHIVYYTGRTPTNKFNKVQFGGFTAPILYNIVDQSSFGGLTNNNFRFVHNAITYNLTLVEGSWDAGFFSTYLSNSMSSAVGVPNLFLVQYDLNLLKLRIETTDNSNFSLDFTIAGNCAYEMGFDDVLYAGTNVYISDFTINFTMSQHVYIYIPELGSNSQAYAGNSNVTFICPVKVRGSYLLSSRPIDIPWVNLGLSSPQMVSQLTVMLYYERKGRLYPLVGNKTYSYTLTLNFI